MAKKKPPQNRTTQPTAKQSSAASDERVAAKLVYIHGIGMQEPEDELLRLWDIALFGDRLTAERGGPSAMARWTDLVRPDAAMATWAARAAGDDEQRIDLGPTLRAQGLDPEDDDIAYLVAGLLQRAGLRERRTAGKKVLPLPGFLRRPVARAFLKAFVGDTAAYFFDAAKRTNIKQRLIDKLPRDRAAPVVLVAHSMGTVIALEVLAELAAQGQPVNLRSFVTLGSPLGIQEVQDFLACPLAVPPGVQRWVNYADPLDPVALDKGLGNDITPRDDGAHRLVRVEDHLIVNERTLRGNPHSSLGYLADHKVRTTVAHAMRLDVMARFLVARDVAVNLGDPTERQPVLIEVREPSQKDAAAVAGMRLPERVTALRDEVEKVVRRQFGPARGAKASTAAAAAVTAARIDPLRHFVAAHLTPAELLALTAEPEKFHIHAVWKSSTKRKTVTRATRAVQADAARTAYAAKGDGVHWAVLDTGVAATHPQLRNAVVHVWDCTGVGKPKAVQPATAVDRDGHGTHVCGILAGTTADGGHTGVAPAAQLHVYKVLDDVGGGEDAWIIKALDHIAEHNAGRNSDAIRGINLSLGGPFDSTVYGCGFSPVCQELRRLWREGVLVVVASGNEGQVDVATTDGEVELNTPMSIGDPANLEECIAVGSVHPEKPHLYGVSGFSSRGPTADGRMKPDVVAPGERIESCAARWPKGKENDAYRQESGTSMAAPVVSGLLAAFLSARREFAGRPDEVKALLLRTCTDLGRDRYHQGHGLPNLMKMLLEA